MVVLVVVVMVVMVVVVEGVMVVVVFIVHHRFEHWIYALMGSILFAEKVSSAETGERIMENHLYCAKNVPK